MEQPDKPQTTAQYGASASYAGTKATDTHSEYVIILLFPATMFTRKRLIATFIRTQPVLLNIKPGSI